MASGDRVALDASTITAASVRVVITGITGDIPLENFSFDAATRRWSATPVGGSWPNLTSANGNPGSPGSVQVLSAAAGAGQVTDVEGNVLAPNTLLFTRPIEIPVPAIISSVTGTYISGLGTAGATITASGSLGNGALIVEFDSTEV